MPKIEFSVVNGDAFQMEADVLLLKRAQASYGLDALVVSRLDALGYGIEDKLPKPGGYFFTSSHSITAARNLLFIGVPRLVEFGYQKIAEFGKRTLAVLASQAPQTKSALVTVHGPGFGLDEIEAFNSLIGGMKAAISTGSCPPALERIVIVERSWERAKNLSNALATMAPGVPSGLNGGNIPLETKKRVFVAMPFDQTFADTYRYGIYEVVRRGGYLCERADMEYFLGDVMEMVKKKIAEADIFIADLSTANANVYLEVGYALAKDKPTMLLIKEPEKPKFDLRGQRCLFYTMIQDLETKLEKFLAALAH